MIRGKPLALLLILYSSNIFAHSAICDCYDNGDGTIDCEGGFSDGGSAVGTAIRVVNSQNKVLIQGKMNDESIFSFTAPKEQFSVIFDAGQGHSVIIDGDDIEE